MLGIDFGSRRIGLAISDAEERVAFPAGTLESRGRKADAKGCVDYVVRTFRG